MSEAMKPGTPLPWSFVPWHIEEGPPAVRAAAGHLVTSTASDQDAAYIVHACNNYPATAREVEELRAEVERLREAFNPVAVADELFAAIEHGDSEHRAWLRKKLDEFFAALASKGEAA